MEGPSLEPVDMGKWRSSTEALGPGDSFDARLVLPLHSLDLDSQQSSSLFNKVSVGWYVNSLKQTSNVQLVKI